MCIQSVHLPTKHMSTECSLELVYFGKINNKFTIICIYTLYKTLQVDWKYIIKSKTIFKLFSLQNYIISLPTQNTKL